MDTHTLSISNVSTSSKRDIVERWKSLLSWPPEDIIRKQDWQILQRMLLHENSNSILVNENSILRFDGIPFAATNPVEIENDPRVRRRHQTVLHLLASRSGIASFYLDHVSQVSLQRLLSWEVLDAVVLCDGKLIMSLIRPPGFKQRCDRFLWSPITPEMYLWHYGDTMEYSAILTIISDEIVSIGHRWHGNYERLYRVFDGMEIILMDETKHTINFVPEWTFVSVSIQIVRLDGR